MQLAGIILAAGESRRMGFPKPLLELDGKSFLARAAEALFTVCDPVIVVLGHHAERVRGEARLPRGVVWVRNPEPERGMLSSLQCGLRAVPDEAAGVMFLPVDYPLLRPASVERLGAAFGEGAGRVWIPTCEGRHGHPVCLAHDLAGEIFALPEQGRPRDVIHAHRGETRYVEVGDPGILRDADTPEAFQAMTRRES